MWFVHYLEADSTVTASEVSQITREQERSSMYSPEDLLMQKLQSVKQAYSMSQKGPKFFNRSIARLLSNRNSVV